MYSERGHDGGQDLKFMSELNLENRVPQMKKSSTHQNNIMVLKGKELNNGCNRTENKTDGHFDDCDDRRGKGGMEKASSYDWNNEDSVDEDKDGMKGRKSGKREDKKSKGGVTTRQMLQMSQSMAKWRSQYCELSHKSSASSPSRQPEKWE